MLRGNSYLPSCAVCPVSSSLTSKQCCWYKFLSSVSSTLSGMHKLATRCYKFLSKKPICESFQRPDNKQLRRRKKQLICQTFGSRKDWVVSWTKKHEDASGNKESYKCNHCEYVSSLVGNFRTHLKTHSGEKSNKCNQCDYAFFQAGHLREHLKTHSREVKQIQSVRLRILSGRPFEGRRRSLRRNLKSHSGEKPNKCILCD